MRPFDSVITLFSFIYSLALARFLLAVGRMIRRRRQLAFDWAHALWMLVALLTPIINRLAFWDVHTIGSRSSSTPTIPIFE